MQIICEAESTMYLLAKYRAGGMSEKCYPQSLCSKSFTMKKQLVTLLILLIGTSHLTQAQIEDYRGARLYVLRTSFNNNDLPGNDGESRFSIGLDAVIGKYEKGQLQFAYRAPLIDDAVPEVAKLLNGSSAETPGETFLMSLIPGWLQLGYNVFSTDNLCISPGIFLGDFWYTAVATQNFLVPGQSGTIEPSGWYGAAGPAIFVDFALPNNKDIVFHYESFFAFSQRWSESSKVEEDENFNPDSEDPYFFKSRFELRYKKVYLGYRWVTAINRYDVTSDINNGSRTDIQLGFIF